MGIPRCFALVLFGLLPFALSTHEEVMETGFGKDLAEDAHFDIRITSINILQGGNHAPEIGFPDAAFGGSRKDDIARVIIECGADVVRVQEDDSTDGLLKELGVGSTLEYVG